MANARKLRLKIGQLQVESFDTRDVAEGRGTVHGHDLADTATAPGGGEGAGCQCQTIEYTCEGYFRTCFYTCIWVNGQPAIGDHC